MIPPSGSTIWVRILATSDVHMHLKCHDYFSDTPLQGRGLEGLCAQIEDLRRETLEQGGVVLLLDNGDLLQGTPLGDLLAEDTARTAPHPVSETLNALDYDAMGLGNHDVDYGLPYLARFADDLKGPVVSSNLHLTDAGDAGTDWLHRSVILTRGALRIGVMSVLPERTMQWAHTHLDGRAEISDMKTACAQTAQALRAAGADLVIALAHTGIGQCRSENALGLIAEQGGIDALIGGHTHKTFPTPPAPGGPNVDPHARLSQAMDLETGHLFGVPTVMPGYAAEALGCIDLHVTATPDGPKYVSQSRARLVRAGPDKAKIDDTRTPLNAIEPAHHAARERLNAVLGETQRPLTSYMAQVHPTRLLALGAYAKIDAITRAAQQSPFADLPVLAAIAPSRAGGAGGPANYADIPAGSLRRRQLAEIHAFPNMIWGVPVTGEELLAWLEKAAVAFCCPDEIAQHGLLCPLVPSFDFDVLFGVSYEINPCAPPRYSRDGSVLDRSTQRIDRFVYNGRPIAPQDRFLGATNSYRACGGGQFPGLTPEREMLRADLQAATVIQEFVARGAHIPDGNPWRFSEEARGLHTWFDTGPGALAHLEDIAHLSPGTPERQETGFVRIPITL